MTQPRRSIPEFLALAACLGVASCAQVTGGGLQSANQGPLGQQSAFFKAFPASLFDAIAAGCQTEADDLRRISERELICESLPSPEAAAALILEFDGDVTELPRLITTLVAVPDGDGFAVTTEYFYRVPTRAGEIAEVRFRAARVERLIERAFVAAGGELTD